MLAVYVWHTVIPRFPNLPKTSNVAVLSPKLLKRAGKDRKRLLKKFWERSQKSLWGSAACRTSSSQQRKTPSRRTSGSFYLQSAATLNEAAVSASSVQSGTSLARAGPTPWSRTGASCTPSFRLETWCHESAVLGWSSSCRIFSCSSFSSSFCG